mmetsp:Transcript_44274/g.105435  ORF Transcript_44274/g.105435 Transcript_44274/m.105435 type:complete len:207 (+) Transcript_44274:1033-1653(+)
MNSGLPPTRSLRCPIATTASSFGHRNRPPIWKRRVSKSSIIVVFVPMGRVTALVPEGYCISRTSVFVCDPCDAAATAGACSGACSVASAVPPPAAAAGASSRESVSDPRSCIATCALLLPALLTRSGARRPHVRRCIRPPATHPAGPENANASACPESSATARATLSTPRPAILAEKMLASLLSRSKQQGPCSLQSNPPSENGGHL